MSVPLGLSSKLPRLFLSDDGIWCDREKYTFTDDREVFYEECDPVELVEELRQDLCDQASVEVELLFDPKARFIAAQKDGGEHLNVGRLQRRADGYQALRLSLTPTTRGKL